jgi:hypothetical protein
VSAQAPADGTHPALISEDDWELLNAKVEEQHQDKVESGSKFRLKLSGLLLMNALSTSGQVDNLDLANVALPSTQTASHGSTAASLRQSIIGLTGTGPTLAGANTAADLQFDFFGGLPAGYGSDGSGIARIRLARMRFDWESRSVVGGLDTPFFSPNSPTTYVSVAEPGFSTAGNLWVWSPSLRLEQRFSVYRSQVKLEGGFLDPVGYAVTGENYRVATPGESSRQPAYAIRVSANRGESDHALSVGVAGVYTPQRFAGGDSVNGGAAMLDWRVPIKAHLELSGEFFDGKGIEAFGGVAPGLPPQNQYQYSATSAYTLGGIRMLGGWSQLKLRVDARNEFNAAAGYGGWVSSALRSAAATDVNLSSIPARNQMFFFNYILRPKSDLLFSLEYRRLRTFEASGAPATADQVGLAAGFLF